MTQDARRSGHLRPDCRGEWVDVTTLADEARVEKCPACGASRSVRGTESEFGTSETGRVDGGRFSPPPWWVLAALAAVLVAWALLGGS